MDREPVESSNIESIGYDVGSRILEVEFKNGGIYQYKGILQEVYKELMEADSFGSYLHQVIKKVYACERIE